jgi:hypothetical protein
MPRKPPRPQDLKTRAAARRHREHPDPPVQGQQTGRQLRDTDGEGGVGGSLDGLYWKEQGGKGPAGTGPGSPRRDPGEVLDMDYARAHAELGDGSADFTSGRAERALEAEAGEPEVTESLTSSGVMDENLDLGGEAGGEGPSVGGPVDLRAPRRPAAENRKDRRKPPDSAIQKP